MSILILGAGGDKLGDSSSFSRFLLLEMKFTLRLFLGDTAASFYSKLLSFYSSLFLFLDTDRHFSVEWPFDRERYKIN